MDISLEFFVAASHILSFKGRVLSRSKVASLIRSKFDAELLWYILGLDCDLKISL